MSHQSDASMFRSVLPEDIEWKPFPAFPPSAIGPLGLEYVNPSDDPRAA